MAVTNTETIGFAEQFNQFLQTNRALLQEKGLDVTGWIVDQNEKRDDAVLQLGRQDELDAAARAQTPVTKASVKTLYDTTSTRLDATIGVLGKSTPLAKEIARLRSSLNKKYRRNTGENSET